MTCHEAWILALAFVGGGLSGAFYFGGLWWTVRRGMQVANPAPWFFGSLILRMAVALLGFYLAARLGVGALLACLAGFVIARQALLHRTRQAPSFLAGRHAP